MRNNNSVNVTEDDAELDSVKSIYTLWAQRTPNFEKKYLDVVLGVLTDYGNKASSVNAFKGKVLGPGYEALIMAFFIGLYSNQRLPITREKKNVSHPLKYWGNVDSPRTSYPELREYMFAALVAKTDINWLDVDKGLIKPKAVVNLLMQTMEEYINYGLSVIADKLENDSGYFYKKTAFLDMFSKLVVPQEEVDPDSSDDDDEPESLD